MADVVRPFNEPPRRRFLTIARTISLLAIGAAAVAALASTLIAYVGSSAALREATEAKLVATLDARRSALEDYLEGVRIDLRLQATNPTIRRALADFRAGWEALEGDRTEQLQRLYIRDNPHPLGSKEKFDVAPDGSAYSDAHARYHPWIRQLLRARGYHDIFLFDPDGNLVYSVFKELDYATNLADGRWADTDLGAAFRAARSASDPAAHWFFDFRRYEPSHGAPASFIAAPIEGDDGAVAGVLVLQMPIDGLNRIMNHQAGLGETGETYIVGGDFLMRSDSRFAERSTILERRVETESARAAIEGRQGVIETTDYRGAPVLSAFAPLDFAGVRWAVLAEQDLAEALAAVAEARDLLAAQFGVVVLLVGATGALIGRATAGSILAMATAMRRLAGGDTAIEVPARARGDEIGEMAEAVRVFKDNAIRLERTRGEQEAAKRRAAEEKRAAIHRVADDFEANVGQASQLIASAATEMRATTQSMSAVADETNAKAAAIMRAASQASDNVGAVASAAQQLISSIDEIGRQVSVQNEAAIAGVDAAAQGDREIRGLAVKIAAIDDVVALIAQVAEQTNLLALNATIESARAGEAGKGFAVVAQEVKALATQTAGATETIGKAIKELREQTGSAVGSIEVMHARIGDIREAASSVAAAIDQQSQAAAEIGRNTKAASVSADEVSSAIVGVRKASDEAVEGSDSIRSGAEQLSEQAEAMQESVSDFLARVRSG